MFRRRTSGRWLAMVLTILTTVLLATVSASAQQCVSSADCTSNGGTVVPLIPGPPGAQICQATAPIVAGRLICAGSSAQSTSTTIASSLNPSTVGQSVTFTATVTGGNPSGTVSFFDGTTQIGGGPVTLSNSGTATVSTSGLSTGSHSITASYEGDSSNLASTSSVLTQTVNPLAPTITSVSPTSGSTAGGTSITITGTNLTGATAVTVGGTAAASFTVVSATSITATTPAGTAGAKDVAVTTAGGTATSSGAFTHLAPQTATSTVVTSSLNPATSGQSVTFTATVTGGNPSGTVTFFDGMTQLGAGPVTLSNSGTATLSTSGLSTGSHSITASYEGDSSNLASTSSVLTQTVNPPAPTVRAVQPRSGSTAGGTTIRILGTDLTGVTAVTVGGTAATGLIVNSATLITATTPAGTAGAKDVAVTTAGGTATLTGAFSYLGPTTTVVTSSLNPAKFGDKVRLTATVSGTNPTGGVKFSIRDGQILSALTPFPVPVNSSGVATFDGTLPGGSLSIIAHYAGDANNLESTSAPLAQTVTPPDDVRTINTTISLSTAFPQDIPTGVTFIADVTSGLAQSVDGSYPMGTARFVVTEIVEGKLRGQPTRFAALRRWLGSILVSPAHAAPVDRVLCDAVPVVNGRAVCSAALSQTAMYRISVTFTGTVNGVPTTVEQTFTVKSPSAVTLAIAPGTVQPGQPFTMTATVLPSAAQGTVSFADGTGAVVPGCGAVPVSSGQATCASSSAAAGPRRFVATYSGSSVNDGSTSAPVSLLANDQAAKTASAIGKFLSARNNQILTSEPDGNRQINRLIEAGGEGGGNATPGVGNSAGLAVSRLGDGPDAGDLSRLRVSTRGRSGAREPRDLASSLGSAVGSGADAGDVRPGAGNPIAVNGSAEGSARFSFATSLRDMLKFAADAQSRKETETQHRANGLGFTTVTRRPTSYQPSPFDVWIEGKYSSFRDDHGGTDTDGHFGLLSIGADYVLNRSLLVGTVVQIDSMRQRANRDATEVSGDGWMVGPYATVRLSPNLFWQSRALWGRSRNEVSPYLTYTDSFETTRWLAASKLTGQWEFGAWSFRPSVSLAFLEDTSKAYVDSFGVPIPAVRSNLGQAKIGPELSYRWDRPDGVAISPYGSAQLIWNFAGDTEATGAGATGIGDLSGEGSGPGGVRGRVELGIKATAPSGIGVELSGSYDGIGASDYNAVSGRAMLRMPLN